MAATASVHERVEGILQPFRPLRHGLGRQGYIISFTKFTHRVAAGIDISRAVGHLLRSCREQQNDCPQPSHTDIGHRLCCILPANIGFAMNGTYAKDVQCCADVSQAPRKAGYSVQMQNPKPRVEQGPQWPSRGACTRRRFCGFTSNTRCVPSLRSMHSAEPMCRPRSTQGFLSLTPFARCASGLPGNDSVESVLLSWLPSLPRQHGSIGCPPVRP